MVVADNDEGMDFDMGQASVIKKRDETRAAIPWTGLLEAVVLALYALLMMEAFLNSTTFLLRWPIAFHTYLRYALGTVAFVRVAAASWESKRELALYSAALVLFLFGPIFSTYTALTDIVLLVIGLRGISPDKVVKTFFVTVSVLLLITVLAALTGTITNLVYYQNGRVRRISFGVNYPTDFAAYFFYLSMAWCYLRKERMRLIEIVAIAGIGAAVKYFCDARLSMISLWLVAAAMLYLKIAAVLKEKKGIELLPGWLMRLITWAMPVCAAFSIACSALYSDRNDLLVKLDTLINHRLSQARLVLDQYGVRLFGQQVTLLGNGGSSRTELIKDYLFLDSSYMMTLVRHGILILAAVVVGFFIMARAAAKRRDYYLLVLIAILAVNAVIEHHLMEINYDPFILVVLSYILRRDSEERTHWERTD